MSKFRAGQVFDLEIVLRGRTAHTSNLFAVRGAYCQARALRDEMSIDRQFQFVPFFERASDQRYIVGMLRISGTNDARSAVRAAEIVAECELLQSQYTLTAYAQLIASGRAHPADAQDDGIVMGDHVAAVVRSSMRKHAPTPCCGGR